MLSVKCFSDTDNFRRGEASTVRHDTPDNQLETVKHNDVVFENNFEDDDASETSQLEETDSGLLDFGDLLDESASRGLQGDSESGHVDHDRQEADGATGRVVETSHGNGILAGSNEV